jgi:hypothetical protein
LQAQATNVKNQLDHSDRQFQVIQRPWVDIKITGINYVIIAPSFLDAQVVYEAINTGNSTATNIYYLFFPIMYGTQTGKECTSETAIKQTAGDNGNAVFPTEGVKGFRITYNPLKNINMWDLKQHPDQLPSVGIVGCVVYKSTIDGKTHHTERFYGIDWSKATATPYPPPPYTQGSFMWKGLKLAPMLEYTRAD